MTLRVLHVVAAGETMSDVLVAAGVAPSKREVRRLFDQGAVGVEGGAVGPRDGGPAGVGVGSGVRRGAERICLQKEKGAPGLEKNPPVFFDSLK